MIKTYTQEQDTQQYLDKLSNYIAYEAIDEIKATLTYAFKTRDYDLFDAQLERLDTYSDYMEKHFEKVQHVEEFIRRFERV